MRPPLTRNRRIAIVCAACASIVPGTAAVFSNRQIATASHSHEFVTGLLLGLSLTLCAASVVFLRRDRSACSSNQTPGA